MDLGHEPRVTNPDFPAGPKPMKSFTPPPEYTEETDSDEYTYTDDSEYTSDEDSESGVVRSGSRVQDEFLTQVRPATDVSDGMDGMMVCCHLWCVYL